MKEQNIQQKYSAKIFSILLSIVLIFTMVQPITLADNSFSVSLDSVRGKAGDNVTVNLQFTNISSFIQSGYDGINTTQYDILYDSSTLELVNSEAGSLVINPDDVGFNATISGNQGEIKVYFEDGSGTGRRLVKADGILAKFNFRIKSEVAPRKSDISFNLNACNLFQMNATTYAQKRITDLSTISFNEGSVVVKPNTLIATSSIANALGVGTIDVSGATAGAILKLYDKNNAQVGTDVTLDASTTTHQFTNVPEGTGYYVTQTVNEIESDPATVDIGEHVKSTDATLGSLSLSEGTLTPAFSSSVTSYTVVWPKDQQLPVITAEPHYELATVAAATYTNATGVRIATVTVTAEDGTTKKDYVINFIDADTASEGNNDITLNDDTHAVIIPNSPDLPSDVTINISKNTENPVISLQASTVGNQATMPVNVAVYAAGARGGSSGSSTGKVALVMPAGTVLTVPQSANGIFNLPALVNDSDARDDFQENYIDENVSVGRNQTLEVGDIVSVGLDDEDITMNTPVMLIFPGAADDNAAYVDSNGVWHSISTITPAENPYESALSNGVGKYKSGKDLIVLTTHFSKYVVYSITDDEDEDDNNNNKGSSSHSGSGTKLTFSSSVTLTDIADHWAKSYIDTLVKNKAISGYPDGTFKPDSMITRGEFATVLVKAFGLTSTSGKVFDDTANHWAKDYVAVAASYGIVSGYNDTTFGVDDYITREQMASMIARAKGLTTIGGANSFTDGDTISDWARDAVSITASNGIINGYPDGTFKPKANATRAEAVTVIVKALSSY